MMQRVAKVTGVGYLFGIDQGQIEEFLTLRGFCELNNASAEDFKRLYFTGPNPGRAFPSGCDIVSARVKSTGHTGVVL